MLRSEEPVNECVGVIGTESHTWVVQPKIPLDHLLLLMERGGVLPRSAPVPVDMAHGEHLFDLLFDWFLSNVEHVLRRDLQRGYTPVSRRLEYVRGTVDQLALARGLLRGQTNVACHFDDFNADIAINRILKSALLKGLRTGHQSETAARRTRRLLARFTGVGEAQWNDLFTAVDRQTRSYATAVELGIQILRGIYRELSEGDWKAWCFLWPTPRAVEAGVRNILAEALDPTPVTNTHAIHGTLSFKADLVIGRHAVGDVKYSFDTGRWRRSDINQLLAFSVAYKRHHLLLINFSPDALEPREAVVSAAKLTRISWWTSIDAFDAQLLLQQHARNWMAVEHSYTTDPLHATIARH